MGTQFSRNTRGITAGNFVLPTGDKRLQSSSEVVVFCCGARQNMLLFPSFKFYAQVLGVNAVTPDVVLARTHPKFYPSHCTTSVVARRANRNLTPLLRREGGAYSALAVPPPPPRWGRGCPRLSTRDCPLSPLYKTNFQSTVNMHKIHHSTLLLVLFILVLMLGVHKVKLEQFRGRRHPKKVTDNSGNDHDG